MPSGKVGAPSCCPWSRPFPAQRLVRRAHGASRCLGSPWKALPSLLPEPLFPLSADLLPRPGAWASLIAPSCHHRSAGLGAGTPLRHREGECGEAPEEGKMSPEPKGRTPEGRARLTGSFLPLVRRGRPAPRGRGLSWAARPARPPALSVLPSRCGCRPRAHTEASSTAWSRPTAMSRWVACFCGAWGGRQLSVSTSFLLPAGLCPWEGADPSLGLGSSLEPPRAQCGFQPEEAGPGLGRAKGRPRPPTHPRASSPCRSWASSRG